MSTRALRRLQRGRDLELSVPVNNDSDEDGESGRGDTELANHAVPSVVAEATPPRVTPATVNLFDLLNDNEDQDDKRCSTDDEEAVTAADSRKPDVKSVLGAKPKKKKKEEGKRDESS